MTEMIRRLLRQKFGSPLIACALAAIALLTASTAAAAGLAMGASSAYLALIILAARSVSKDASSGALQMILARPIRRTEYLYGRYLGILCAYALFLAACGVLAFVFALGIFPALRVPVAPVHVGPFARDVAGSFLGAVLFSAILLFFSTFLPGYGDVLGYFLLALLLSLPQGLGQTLGKPWLTEASRVARENVLPELDWSEVLAGKDPLGAPTGRWVLAVAAFLVAAALVFRRREFAYGQD
jgi:ABC-type transport system involved in multi-copper enzyme maturation permease subunit